MNTKEKLMLLHAEKKNAEHDIAQLEADHAEAVKNAKRFEDRELYGDGFREQAAKTVAFYGERLNAERLRLKQLRLRIGAVRREQERDVALVAAYGY